MFSDSVEQSTSSAMNLQQVVSLLGQFKLRQPWGRDDSNAEQVNLDRPTCGEMQQPVMAMLLRSTKTVRGRNVAPPHAARATSEETNAKNISPSPYPPFLNFGACALAVE